MCYYNNLIIIFICCVHTQVLACFIIIYAVYNTNQYYIYTAAVIFSDCINISRNNSTLHPKAVHLCIYTETLPHISVESGTRYLELYWLSRQKLLLSLCSLPLPLMLLAVTFNGKSVFPLKHLL